MTLVAGVGLEVSGEGIARQTGMTGVLFGATILAAATALPEISTGLAAMKLRDYQMAMGDIFGGNAFCRCCFWWPLLCQASLFFLKHNERISILLVWQFC